MRRSKTKQNFDFPYEVIRTNRKKSATIKIEQGVVQFIIPKTLSQKRLELLIQQKTEWVQRKLHECALKQTVKPKEYINGECFTYLGKNYRLKLQKELIDTVKLQNGQFVVGIGETHDAENKTEQVQSALLHWYIVHAKEKLQAKTLRYAQKMGVQPASVQVKTYKSRWGSCSAHGDITYNWKIIIAPNRVIDYVVVHELCHLLHHNHSSDFWNTVERYFADYRECKEWLRVHADSLTI